MSWRTVVISHRCKLDLKLGYMVVRGEETRRVFLDEIAMLMIENTAVSITCSLLSALTDKKIKVIFCDEKRNPTSELAPYYGSHDCTLKLRNQLNWNSELKGALWTEIVSEKIRKQSEFLLELGKMRESELLNSYIENIEYNDESNREGHAAKVYFNAVFGMDFTRGDNENVINAALNYGYSIILSAVNREVALNGYLTQIGLFHDNMFNFFNLSCDLMEPFRIIVDRKVKKENYSLFETDEKHSMLEILNQTLLIDGKHQTTINAIKIYVKSVFDSLNDKDLSLIRFAKYEL